MGRAKMSGETEGSKIVAERAFGDFTPLMRVTAPNTVPYAPSLEEYFHLTRRKCCMQHVRSKVLTGANGKGPTRERH
jgi:hypothetical protein